MSVAFAPQPVWLFAGPTASGKSSLALAWAQRTGGEIVNADSMQVYRDLRVLTARPSEAEEALARHRLYGVADASEAWSAGHWLAAAETALHEIASAGRLAIVVGGTGLYFKALTEGLSDIPQVPPEARAEASARLQRQGEAEFRRMLAAVDAPAEARIAPGDRQRLTRAMEVWLATGRPLSHWQGGRRPALSPASWRGMVLEPPREVLRERIDRRLAAMFDGGALEEVERLMARGLSERTPVMKAMGVAPIAAFLRGEISRGEALALAQAQTRQYAKRQLTWFRHQTAGWPRIASADAALDLQGPARLY